MSTLRGNLATIETATVVVVLPVAAMEEVAEAIQTVSYPPQGHSDQEGYGQNCPVRLGRMSLNVLICYCLATNDCDRWAPSRNQGPKDDRWNPPQVLKKRRCWKAPCGAHQVAAEEVDH